GGAAAMRAGGGGAVRRPEVQADDRAARGADLPARTMTEVLAFAAYLALPLIGLGIWRLEAVRRLDLPARLAVAIATGALITAAVMTLLSIAHIHWSRTVLIVILATIAAAWWPRGGKPPAPGNWQP